MRHKTNIVLMLTCMLAAFGQRAAAQVVVSKTTAAISPIDISGLACSPDSEAALFRQTLADDLNRWGWFSVIAAGRAEFTLLGSAEKRGGSLDVKCEVYHTATRERRLGKAFSMPENEARRLAHKVADEIVYAVHGVPGVASTRIMFVGNRTGQKEIYICDSDGWNLTQLTADKTLNLYPKWGPDAKTFVYTSFRSGFPDVYLVEMDGGRRKCVANYRGLNSAAAISPAGGEMALTLSKDGTPNLYVKDLNSGRVTRLTRSRNVDASPCWSPDGRQLVYVSDQAGSPNLYIIDRSGGEPARVTSRGSQNVDPDWGANGYIVYSSLINRRFQIMVLNPKTLETTQLTDGDANHEDPSWAPDGRHIVFTLTRNYRAEIFIVDTMTRSSICLAPSKGENWESPSWSPK